MASRTEAFFGPAATTVGILQSKMLFTPATATWVVPFMAYHTILSGRIVYQRLVNWQLVGDRLTTRNKPATTSTTDSKGGQAGKTEGEYEVPAKKEEAGPEKDPLFLASRAHANFVENVPLALVLSLLAELNGGNRKVLNYALGTLFVLRIAHVEIGLYAKSTVGIGRILGYYGTQGFLVAMAGYCAFLSRAYWGF